MKLPRHLYLRLWDVHAWLGVIGGLLLYLMFLCGVVSLFREQITVWQEPLYQQHAPDAALMQRVLSEQLPAGVDDAWLAWPHDIGTMQLEYSDPASKEWQTFLIDAKSGKAMPVREKLMAFVFGVHFMWHELTGRPLMVFGGFISLALLLATVTGLLIHLKDVFRDFHQFRPHRAKVTLWSDLHKVLGTTGLPFQMMMAYTGAIIILMPLMMKGASTVWSEPHVEKVVWGGPDEESAKDERPMAPLPLPELMARAQAQLSFTPHMLHLERWGRADAVLDVNGASNDSPEAEMGVHLRAVDGAVLTVEKPEVASAASATWRWVYGLHFARFGGQALRWLYVVLGLAGAVVMTTGNFIWLKRREARAASRGNRLLAKLNVGIGIGVPVALGTIFVLSRVLPMTLESRVAIEQLGFLGALAACIGWACAARELNALWWKGFGLAGVLLLVTPVLALRVSNAGLFGSERLLTVWAVDAGLLGFGAACLVLAWVIRRAQKKAVVTS